jgi:NAD(P)-dependent dehydrogenase (short-subunit alcohol dehydrogenase family)
MKLDGKTALIAGCSPNISAGIALELAKEGARLVCVDLQAPYAQACADAVVRSGGEAIAFTADVTDEAAILAAIRKAEERFGGIDILVNGAVVQHRQGLLDLPVAKFRQQMEVILVGTFIVTKLTAQSMIKQKRRGVIINTVSTEGHQGNPGNIGYGTAKSGLLNFTRGVAMELAPYGIRVNSLTPTATDSAEGQERVKEWGLEWNEPAPGVRSEFTSGDQGVPLGKRPSPSHYGKAAVFLASDDSEMITGFDLRVDGGTIARYWRWNPGASVTAAEKEI